jgi:hypothetical protein
VCAEADKAKEKMMAEKLEREKLAGDKDVAGKNYESESAAYKLVITPYEREIYVITMIKIKINEHCDKLAKVSRACFLHSLPLSHPSPRVCLLACSLPSCPCGVSLMCLPIKP